MEGNDEDDSTRRIIQEKFEEYGVSEVYIINFWNAIFFLCIALILTFITSMVDFYIQHRKTSSFRAKEISLKIAQAFRWNFPIIIIISNFDSILIYSIYSYMKFDSERTASIVNLILSAIFLILALAILIASFVFVKKSLAISNEKSRGSKSYKQFWDEKWGGFAILFKGGKEKNFWT